MPIGESNSLNSLKKALEYYYSKMKKQLTYEYILFNDFNDSIEDAKNLYSFTKHTPSKVNIIEYNPIENGQYETYFTEKLLDCFATGTIPVYLGAPDIGDYFNKDGIIDLTEEFDVSDEIYYNKMDAIKDNLERTKKMEILEDFIWENYFND